MSDTPPLDLRSLVLTSGLSAIYPHAGTGDAVALRYLAARLSGDAGTVQQQLRHPSVVQKEFLSALAYGMQGVIWTWLRVCAETGLDPYELVSQVFKDMSFAAATTTAAVTEEPLPQRVPGMSLKPRDQALGLLGRAGLQAGIDYGFSGAAGMMFRRVPTEDPDARAAAAAYDAQEHVRLTGGVLDDLCGEDAVAAMTDVEDEEGTWVFGFGPKEGVEKGWRCQRCQHVMQKNQRLCFACGYTVFDPIHRVVSPEPADE